MVNDTTTGNALIREQVANMLIEPLEAASVVLGSGVTIFDSSEPLKIPRLEAGFTPGWVGENEKIPDTDTADFDELALMPSERKSIKTITRVSNELVRQATLNVSAVLEKRLVEDVRRVLDDGLLNGDGADDTITGIFNQPGVTRVAHDPLETDSYLDALAASASMESNPNRFIVSGADFYNLRKIKDGDGRYIMQPDPASGTQFTLFEIPVTVTNKVAPGQAALLDMSEVAVVRDIDPRVTILTEKYADYDQVGIRVVTRYDLGLLRPSNVIILDATAG